MFSTTFLGWQSWLTSTTKTRVLVDPLFDDSGIGRGPRGTRYDFIFWPPRRFEQKVCPAIDAVVLSHEHEDHFNISSLVQIDRTVPVLLSARSSTAASTILKEMGFRVQRVYPGTPVNVGDLRITFMSPDLRVPAKHGDEWDTLGYLVEDTGGHGSFFSNVDIAFDARMTELLATQPNPALVSEAMTLALWHEDFAHAEISEMHRMPWPKVHQDALAALRNHERIRPIPGNTFVFRDGGLVSMEAQAPYLSVPPLEEWAPRKAFWARKGSRLEPITVPRELTDAEITELETGLEELARYMYGGEVFRHLYSLSAADLDDGRRATMTWFLCTTSLVRTLVYEYRPEACRFLRREDSSPGRSAGTVRSWATDLLQLFRGEFEPRCAAKGFEESWISACQNIRFYMETLWPFFHPLRHPEKCLKRYRETLSEEPRRDILFPAQTDRADGG